MSANKYSLRFVLVARGCISAACVLIISACSLGTPSYAEKLVFELGVKHLIIDVSEYCTYEVGVSFSSESGGEAIKSFFGHAREINFPAMIDISLLDASGEAAFSIAGFGGSVTGYRYGPNPLKLIAGKVYLVPGKYTAIIDIKNVRGDFSGFESELFVSGDSKVSCEK